MGNWRNYGEDHHHHWSRSSSSFNKKPPLNIWRPTVPRWEKRFCASAGITWSKLVETKKYLWLYEKVMNWDDSGGREAFDNAKKRFWALMNGLPCDIPLPDPNTYIGDVDWDTSVDLELVLDFEKDDIKPGEQGQDEKVVINIDDFMLLNQSFSGNGCGVDEADTPKHTELVSGAHYHPANNITREWNQRDYYWSYTYGNGRGATWNMANAYHDRSGHQIGSEGRNSGGQRGNFAYNYCQRGSNAPNA